MIYATYSDLASQFEERELIQLTDDDETGAVNEARIDKALSSASAVVEGYVAATYTFDPALPIPTLLVDITCDIARFRLYRTETPDKVATAYSQAIRMLESIRSGKTKLDGGVETLEARPGKILISNGDRQMSRCQLRDY